MSIKARPNLYPRAISRRIATALADTPVVMVNGPRQCGKTTLVRGMAEAGRDYITLDDDTTLAAAGADPTGFIRGLDRAIIDEVQRAPDLLLAVKRSVDEDRRPGRFLLTGSANVLTIPRVSESLAGRMEIMTLMPLAQAEIRRHGSQFLEQAFAGRIAAPRVLAIGEEFVKAVLIGGYPEMLARTEPHRRAAWARDYVSTIVARDVRDVAEVDKLQQMSQLVRALSHHAGQLINFSQLAGQLRLDGKTAQRYVGVLEQLFLIRRIEPWFSNRLKRLVKTPKLHFLDSGLLAALLGVTPERIARERALFGPLLETFVFAELLKLTTWGDLAVTMYHYRDKDQDEIDLVLEDDSGGLVGIEVKSAATVMAADFRALRKVAEAAGDAFRLGIVLYDADRIVPFGDKLYAVPLSCLWNE